MDKITVKEANMLKDILIEKESYYSGRNMGMLEGEQKKKAEGYRALRLKLEQLIETAIINP